MNSVILEIEKTQAAIPVYEVLISDWLSEFGEVNVVRQDSTVFGLYYNLSKKRSIYRTRFGSRFIVLNRDQPVDSKLFALHHELAHHNCSLQRCNCVKDTELAEEHANTHALLVCLGHGWFDALRVGMERIAGVSQTHFLPAYRSAAITVMGKKIWGECATYLSQKGKPLRGV